MVPIFRFMILSGEVPRSDKVVEVLLLLVVDMDVSYSNGFRIQKGVIRSTTTKMMATMVLQVKLVVRRNNRLPSASDVSVRNIHAR